MKARIQQLIKEGKLEKAIESLLEYTVRLSDKDLYNEVTHHSAVFNRIEKTGRLGTDSTEEQNIAYAKMNQALLGVVKQLPDDSVGTSAPGISYPENKNKSISKTVFYIIGIIALLLLSYLGYRALAGDEEVVYKCNERICRDCVDCYNSGCFEEAYRCLTALKKPTSEDEKLIQVCIAITNGDKSLVDGQFFKAKGLYLRAIDLDPSVEIHRVGAIRGIENTERADSLMEAGRYTEARTAYNRSLESDNGVISKYVQGQLAELDEREKGKPKSEKDELKKLLAGKWIQSKSGKEGEISGVLSFELPGGGDSLKVMYKNQFANGAIQTGELVNLTYLPDQTSFTGVWHNFSTQQRGTFFFVLDTLSEKLTGKYSLSLSADPSYYWNGDKK